MIHSYQAQAVNGPAPVMPQLTMEISNRCFLNGFNFFLQPGYDYEVTAGLPFVDL